MTGRLAGLLCALPMLCYQLTGTFSRQRALHYAAAHHVQPCAVLGDPTIRSYADWLPAQMLKQADPDDFAYMRTHTILISVVSRQQLAACRAADSYGSAGVLNIPGTPYIILAAAAPQSMAAALSEGLLHVRYGDPTDPAFRRSLLSRLWRSEDEDAHQRRLKTERLLQVARYKYVGARSCPSGYSTMHV